MEQESNEPTATPTPSIPPRRPNKSAPVTANFVNIRRSGRAAERAEDAELRDAWFAMLEGETTEG